MPRLLVLLSLALVLALVPLMAAAHPRAYRCGFVITTPALRLSSIHLRRAHPLLPPSAVGSMRSISGPRCLAQPPAVTPQHKRKLVVPLLRRRGGSFHLDPAVVKASLTAVAELLISCGIGAFATRKGVLDRTVISSLSKVVYNLLLPALLFANVARTVYSKPLSTLLPLPGFATMQIAMCAVIARLVNFALRLDPKSIKGREVGVCSAFGNSGVVPILFATVLLRNHPDPSVLPLAISYISFYLLGWSPWFWTVGYQWLAGPKEGATQPAPVPAGETSVKARIQRFIKNPPPAVGRVLSPPIIGCMSGLLLGVSPLARFFLGKDAPLGVFTNAIDTLGKAYASSALLVLAGSLALPTPPAAPGTAETPPAKGSTLSAPLQIASICLVRFLLCPALFLTIVLKAMSRGLVTLDRLMLFVLFLESCMPSAQNTVIIHSLEGRAADGTRLARLLLWIYVLSCVPLSILLTLYLQRFGL